MPGGRHPQAAPTIDCPIDLDLCARSALQQPDHDASAAAPDRI